MKSRSYLVILRDDGVQVQVWAHQCDGVLVVATSRDDVRLIRQGLDDAVSAGSSKSDGILVVASA